MFLLGVSVQGFSVRGGFCPGSLCRVPPLYGKERAVRILLECIIITGRNEVVAKVIFLHLSVILFTGGVSASVHAEIPPPPPEQTPSGTRHPPGPDTPPEQTPPPRSRHPPGADTPPEQTPWEHTCPPWDQTPPQD